MSSGQSLRNGNSVEPGLPNTFLIPNARSRSSVACLTVTEVALVLEGLPDNACYLRFFRVIARSSDGAIHTSCLLYTERWIASRSLSSGAHSRDPLARNDGS